MTEKITYIKRESTDRQGNALVTKAGKPYVRVLLKVASKGDRYISGFSNTSNDRWEIGDDVDVVITESDKLDKDGKPYLNFGAPKKEDPSNEKLEQILNALTGIKLHLTIIEGKIGGKKENTEDSFEEPNFEVPF